MYAVVNKRSWTRIPDGWLTDELRAYPAPHYEDAEMTIHTDEFCARRMSSRLIVLVRPKRTANTD